ncbi:hypothetical protein IU447_27565 [Nocardia farcinica]|uniref:hypothetical protein n=1 Tax=Nocardia farcinica TaxID=37329 RepID=UPI00189509E2|nr:hypothetical protein [Nocardia farcinica]MBF6363868.1 hypothetical protein [Nocardia farcinica]
MVQVAEWLVKLVAGDAANVEVEPLEKCLVKVAADGVGSGSVELGRVDEQVEPTFENVNTDGQLGTGGGEAHLDLGAIGVDGAQSGFDLGLGEGAVSGEVDQPFLFGVEFLESGGEAGVHRADAGLFISQCFVQEFGTDAGFGDRFGHAA